jgi:hypothetical protein
VNVPVTFSNAKLANVTKTEATITWTTNTPATSKGKYGIFSIFLNKETPEDKTLTTTHSIIITGLSSRKYYYVKLYSTNAAGKQYTSKTYSFRTL